MPVWYPNCFLASVATCGSLSQCGMSDERPPHEQKHYGSEITMELKKLALTCAAAMLLVGTAAWADDIDFNCSLGAGELCTGTITKSGSNYSTNGISVYDDSGPYSNTVPFTLTFNTLTDKVSIDGTGKYAGQNLLGDITSWSVSNGSSSTDLSFVAVWPTLPPLVQAFLGSKTGLDSGLVITSSLVTPCKGGKAASGDVLITPTPEPASLALFGSGLLAIGGALRRKLRRK